LLGSIHKYRFHRKDAKDAEKFFNENKKTLCVFAVNYLFSDE